MEQSSYKSQNEVNSLIDTKKKQLEKAHNILKKNQTKYSITKSDIYAHAMKYLALFMLEAVIIGAYTISFIPIDKIIPYLLMFQPAFIGVTSLHSGGPIIYKIYKCSKYKEKISRVTSIISKLESYLHEYEKVVNKYSSKKEENHTQIKPINREYCNTENNVLKKEKRR